MKAYFSVTSLVLMLAMVAVHSEQSSAQNAEPMQQEAQRCMAGVDPSVFREIERKGRLLQSEISRLCKSGERDAAMEVAVNFSQEVAADKNIKQLKKCSEQFMLGMPPIPDYQAENEAGHICDEIK